MNHNLPGLRYKTKSITSGGIILLAIALVTYFGDEYANPNIRNSLAAKPEGCTIGAAMGNATADSRPISWKNRDENSNHLHFLKYSTVEGGKYGFLGVGYGERFDLITVNDAGLAMQIADCWNINNSGDEYIKSFKLFAMTQTGSISEIRRAIEEDISGKINHWEANPADCIAFSDAHGQVTLFELQERTPYRLNYYEYDPLNPVRKDQFPVQIITRSNTAHLNENGMDDEYVDQRYSTARDDLMNYAIKGELDVQNWFKNISRHGQPGVDHLASNDQTRAVMLVNGVNEGEDPRIVTAWVGLGNPDYTMVIPVWAAQKNELSPKLTLEGTSSIGEISGQLMLKNDYHDYDQYINGLFGPVEDNIYEAVEKARKRWLSSGFELSEATRIHFEAAETAWQTMNSMREGSGRTLNAPPELSLIDASVNGLLVKFSLAASDRDGSVVAYDWDFGDGSGSSSSSPMHLFPSSETYLVRARVVDDDGGRNSRWIYVTVDSRNSIQRYLRYFIDHRH